MSDKLSVNFESTLGGLDELIGNLSGAGNDIPGAARKIIEKAQKTFQEYARGYAPVDTGKLKKLIETRPVEEDGNRVSGAVASTAEYSACVEFGTGKKGSASLKAEPERGLDIKYSAQINGQEAQPFFGVALEDMKDKYPEIATDVFTGMLKEGLSGG